MCFNYEVLNKKCYDIRYPINGNCAIKQHKSCFSSDISENFNAMMYRYRFSIVVSEFLECSIDHCFYKHSIYKQIYILQSSSYDTCFTTKNKLSDIKFRNESILWYVFPLTTC